MFLKNFTRTKAIIILSVILSLIITIAGGMFVSAGLTSPHSINLNNIFNVNIPKDFSYKKANYALSEDITQHYILQGKKKYSAINGYIQVWTLKSPITDYIEQAENNLSASVYNYDKKPVLQNGSTGFDISFILKGEPYDTFVRQTLWQRDTHMYVISLSTQNTPEQINVINETFETIKNSVTLYGDSLPSGKLVEYCIQDI